MSPSGVDPKSTSAASTASLETGAADSWRASLEAVHASPWKTVLAVTGGGSGAIAALLEIPGASATLLEARVPYAASALRDWLGAVPDQAVSADTALSMACAAWQRGTQLEVDDHEHLLGISCTASLASDRPKRGAHRIHVSSQSIATTTLYSLELEKGARNRRGEEGVASALLLHALTRACGLEVGFEIPLVAGERIECEQQSVDPALADVFSGRSPGVWSLGEDRLVAQLESPPRGVLCGSFDPLHAGHEALRAAAEKHLGGPVYFELTLRNADKPPLDYLRLERRRRQFGDTPLRVGGQASFVDKAAYLPGVTFVVGVDTAHRIMQSRFYPGGDAGVSEALAKLRDAGVRFLVAGRKTASGFETLADVSVPPGFEDLFAELSETAFRSDISSTELRARGAKPRNA